MKPSKLKTVAERVSFYMKDLNLPKKRIARLMGIDEEEFDRRVVENTFTLDCLKKFSDNISEASYTWLMIGAGDPYNKKQANKDIYDYEGINNFVIEIRKANGFTQAEFAEIMGIARTTQSAIERNQQTITIGYMRRLHQKFKVPYHAIIDQVDKDLDAVKEIGKMKSKADHYKKMLLDLGVDKNLL